MAESTAQDSHSGGENRSNIKYCVLLAALPVAAALLPQLWVELLVPRDTIASYLPALAKPPQAPAFGTIPALYHYAIAASCTVVAAIASLYYSAKALRATFSNGTGRLPGHVVLLLVAAVGIAAICLFDRGTVDDTTARLLFKQSGVAPIHPRLDWFGLNFASALPFDWDGRILGFTTYLAFLVAAVTCAAAATTAPSAPYPGTSQPVENGPAKQRMTVVRTSLYFATAVLLVSMVTAKLRFDVGLAAIGAPAKGVAASAAYSSYEAVANALIAYWSVVLSLALAALYVPPALALYPPYLWEKGEKEIDWLALNEENITRALRLIAIVSPPIIAQVIKGFTG